MRIVFGNPRRSTKTPGIFLDRDGVINHRIAGSYVLDWSQFVFIPGIREALKQLAALDLPMIVVSNQACVGRGLLTPSLLEGITAKMQQILSSDGAPIAAAYYCTHSREDNCECRKPKPALLLRAAEEFDVDLHQSIFVGDSNTDVEAAEAAGCRPILFGLNPDARLTTVRPNLATAPDAGFLFEIATKCLPASFGG